jgi:glycosyltransferase involved in cell wall biosynthesis
MSIPEVSVIVPTRNRCLELGLAVRSALGQLGVQLEVVIVDDGSTDATGQLVSRISDPRVRYLRRTMSVGVSAARNAGIAEARGRWIAFLDDDDVWAPTKLARQIEVMAASGRTWSYAGDVVVDRALNILAGGPPPPPDVVVRSLERHNSVPAGASNIIVGADALATAGPFDPELSIHEDWDMWIRLARAGPPDWVCSPLVAISFHDHNASRDTAAMLRQLVVVAERYGIRVDRARHLRWAAWYALLEGRRADATGLYVRAVAAGDITSLGRAAVTVLSPRYPLTRVRPKDPVGEPDPWIAEARAWLNVVAQAERRPCEHL